MIATTLDARTRLESYLGTARVCPLFVMGDALDVLREFPSDTFDCCMTSLPCWSKREYAGRGIGLERGHWADWSWILSAGRVRPCPFPPCSAGNPWAWIFRVNILRLRKKEVPRYGVQR